MRHLWLTSRTRKVESGRRIGGADRAGTAIGTLEYQRRPEAPSLPVRLAPQPVPLAGREELLPELDARLAKRLGPVGPRLSVLRGLGVRARSRQLRGDASRLLISGASSRRIAVLTMATKASAR